jgi:hypothetical protein
MTPPHYSFVLTLPTFVWLRVTNWEEFNFRTVTFRSDILLCVRADDHGQGTARSRTDAYKYVVVPWAYREHIVRVVTGERGLNSAGSPVWLGQIAISNMLYMGTHQHLATLSTQYDRRVQGIYTKQSCLYTSLVSCTPFHWTGFDPAYVTATSHISRISFRVSVTSSFLLSFAVHRVSMYLSTKKWEPELTKKMWYSFKEKGRVFMFLYTGFFWSRRPYVTYIFYGSKQRRYIIQTYVLGLCFRGKTILNIIKWEGRNNV